MTARTATVTGILERPGPGQPYTAGRVSARLNVDGFTLDGLREKIGDRLATVDPATGAWSMVLELNDDLDPAGTWWSVRVAKGVIWRVQLRAEHAGLIVPLRSVLADVPSNPHPAFVVYGIGNVDGGHPGDIYAPGMRIDEGAIA